MKLGECYLDGSKDSCLSMGQTVSSHMIKAGAMQARVEIHSLDDPEMEHDICVSVPPVETRKIRGKVVCRSVLTPNPTVEDDPPWTTERPNGWGPGWPFRIGDTVMIAADDGHDQHELEILAFVPSTGRIQRVNVLDIDTYGRKG